MNRGVKFTYVDLFCGAGGMTEGFEVSGKFDGLAHIDWEIPMVRTLRHRLQQLHRLSEEEVKKRVIHMDLQLHNQLLYGIRGKKLKYKYKDNHADFINGGLLGNRHTKGVLSDRQVDLVIGGPSCQAYSIAGRAQDKFGMKKDYRNFLFESFVKIVNTLRPKIFIFENVPGMLSSRPKGKLITQLIYEAFHKIGYTILKPNEMREFALFDMSEFGVPQHRKRLIIIGLKQDKDSKIITLKEIYRHVYSFKKNAKKTVRMAIGNMPKILPLSSGKAEDRVSHKLQVKTHLLNHNPRFHNKRDIKIFKEWINGRLNLLNTKEKIAFYNDRKDISKISKKGTNHSKYRNLEWHTTAPTLVAHLQKDGLQFIHPDPEQARSLTVRECARLQTFPDNFKFGEADSANYRMIGNAVPPTFARILAEAIIKYIHK